MGCCTGDREKAEPEKAQKWSFINLSDFKATSSWTTISYIWLWILAVIAVAVYAADTFTAVNLLAFDKWSSQVQPAIPFMYSKWIFAVCIILSWTLCGYEWFRAIRIIQRDGVAESYMDPLAVTVQSMKSDGWRKFLVYGELTKSKKTKDYTALFVYFQFLGAIRIILAEGPRQVVNALTLYSVMQADLIEHGTETDKHSPIAQFFLNFEALAEKNKEQAIILCSMLFTLVIWVFSALCLIAAILAYLLYLWHSIPESHGRLSLYCRHKIDKRLAKIVDHKVRAALEEEEQKRQKQEAKQMKAKTENIPRRPVRQPTLPQVGASPEMTKDDKLPEFALVRQDTQSTMATLPPYSSRPPTRNESQRSFPDVAGERPGMPSRAGTQNSGWSSAPSYRSNAPLLSNAGYAGEERSESPAPPMPAFDRQMSNGSFHRPLPGRTMTQSSQGAQRPFSPMSRTGSPQSRQPVGPRMPVRTNTGFSFDQGPPSAISPVSPHDDYGRPMGPPMRQNTQESFRTAPVRQNSQASSFNRSAPTMSRQPTYGSLHSHQGSFSRPTPAVQRQPSESSFNRPLSPPIRTDTAQGRQTPLLQSQHSYEMTAQTNANLQRQPSDGGYVAFNPSLHSTSATPVPQPGPQRSVTVAGAPGASDNYFGQVQHAPQRSATAPIEQARVASGYGDILDDYGSHEEEEGTQRHPLSASQRSFTAEPRGYGGW